MSMSIKLMLQCRCLFTKIRTHYTEESQKNIEVSFKFQIQKLEKTFKPGSHFEMDSEFLQELIGRIGWKRHMFQSQLWASSATSYYYQTLSSLIRAGLQVYSAPAMVPWQSVKICSIGKGNMLDMSPEKIIFSLCSASRSF